MRRLHRLRCSFPFPLCCAASSIRRRGYSVGPISNLKGAFVLRACMFCPLLFLCCFDCQGPKPRTQHTHPLCRLHLPAPATAPSCTCPAPKAALCRACRRIVLSSLHTYLVARIRVRPPPSFPLLPRLMLTPPWCSSPFRMAWMEMCISSHDACLAPSWVLSLDGRTCMLQSYKDIQKHTTASAPAAGTGAFLAS